MEACESDVCGRPLFANPVTYTGIRYKHGNPAGPTYIRWSVYIVGNTYEGRSPRAVKFTLESLALPPFLSSNSPFTAGYTHLSNPMQACIRTHFMAFMTLMLSPIQTHIMPLPIPSTSSSRKWRSAVVNPIPFSHSLPT